VETLNISIQDMVRGTYPSFMLKMIIEQPQSLGTTFHHRILEPTKGICVEVSLHRLWDFLQCGTFCLPSFRTIHGAWHRYGSHE
jgi:glucosamine 6-phosphate synthetase-like amidotransferase/phosphosugar isomerase protein